jgi:hypothetical protein
MPQWVTDTINWLQIHSPLASYGTAASAIAAVCTFLWKVAVDSKEARLKRFDKYQEMAKRTDKPPLSTVIDALRKGPAAVTALSKQNKEDYMAFLEEVAVMKNSQLIRAEVAFYMFGGDAIASKNSPEFRDGFKPWGDELYWSVYEKFCDEMEDLDKSYKKAHRFDPKKVRF